MSVLNVANIFVQFGILFDTSLGIFVARQNLKNFGAVKFNQIYQSFHVCLLGFLILKINSCFNASCKLERKSIGWRISSEFLASSLLPLLISLSPLCKMRGLT